MDGIDVITKAPAILISASSSDMVIERLTLTKSYEYSIKLIRNNALRNALDSVLGLV